MTSEPIKIGYCEHCQSQGEVGKDVFIIDRIQDMEIYICTPCDDEAIQDDWPEDCNCLSNEPSCRRPGCQGYWS